MVKVEIRCGWQVDSAKYKSRGSAMNKQRLKSTAMALANYSHSQVISSPCLRWCWIGSGWEALSALHMWRATCLSHVQSGDLLIMVNGSWEWQLTSRTYCLMLIWPFTKSKSLTDRNYTMSLIASYIIQPQTTVIANQLSQKLTYTYKNNN